MSRRKLTQAYRTSAAAAGQPEPVADELAHSLELREEHMVAHKETQEVGEIRVHTEVEQLPGRLEVDAYREEVSVESAYLCRLCEPYSGIHGQLVGRRSARGQG